MAEPIMLFLYGDLGTGKTLQVLRALWGAYWFAPPGELKTAVGPCGFVGRYASLPQRYENPVTLYDLLAWLEQNYVVYLEGLKQGKPFPYSGFVFECFNYVMADTAKMVEARAPRSKRTGEVDNFWVDAEIKRLLDTFRRLVRMFGIHVAFISHARDPRYKDRVRQAQGGILFPTRNLAKMLMTTCDFIAHVVHDPFAIDPFGKLAYEINPTGADDDYPTKDRHGIGRLLKLPANVREVLLACNRLGYNYELPRLPGLEWQDMFAEELAEGLAKGQGDLVNKMFQGAIQRGLLRPHIEWAISDGIARFQLLQGLQRLDNAPISIGTTAGMAGMLTLPNNPAGAESSALTLPPVK